MSGSTWIRFGAASGALAVAAGAFGAHSLSAHLSEKMLAIFETAARYQMYHALALLGVGLLATIAPRPSRSLSVAGWSFLVGTLLFSGSLYAYSITAERPLALITPFGGLGFLVGWIALLLAAGSVKIKAGDEG